MIRNILNCFIFLFVGYINAQNKSVVISFSINDINVEKLDLFIYNKLSNSIIKQDFIDNAFIIMEINNPNITYLIKGKDHVIELPHIDYLSDVENIKITYYDSFKKELFEKKYKKNYIVKKGLNYQIDFGLGDLYFVNYTKEKSKRIKQLIGIREW